MKHLKFLSAAAALVMLLSGCEQKVGSNDGGVDIVDEKPAITDTASLLDMHKTMAGNVSNFTVNGRLEAVISMTSEDENQSATAALGYEANISMDNQLYAKLNFVAAIPDEDDISETIEVYVKLTDAQVDAWYKSESDDTWYYQSVEIDEDQMAVINRKSEFSIDGDFSSTDTAYIITQTLRSVFESEAYKNALSDIENEIGDDDLDSGFNFSIDDIFEQLGTTLEDFYDQLGKAKIQYTFDKNTFRLTNVDLSGFNYELTVPDMDMLFKLSLSFSNIISNYNDLSESDYAVPDEIVNTAEEPYSFMVDPDYLYDYDESDIYEYAPLPVN